ncbi:MAG: prepilin-type N-terminal cleavage/methylation domain-containing protein [bacterium]|nr:prepilin-type N-terminal cleavage/methylation domain-containing protein [bacterium]
MHNYFLKKNTKSKYKQGLSLIETIVAISIFALSILGILVILGGGIANTNYAKNKVIASFLAEEGIETIRNIRDTYDQYSPSPDGWVDFRDKLTVAGCSSNPHGCYFDIQKDINNVTYDMFAASNRPMPITKIYFTSCPITGCIPLLYDSSLGSYTYTSNGSYTTSTGMRRTIKMEINGFNTDEIKITSIVTWVQGTQTRTVAFADIFFNWIQ